MMMVMLIIVALHSPKQRSFRQKVIFSKLSSHITMLMITDHGICIKPMISLQYLYCPQSWKSCPQFRKSEEARQKWSILTPKKVNMRAKKKDFPRIHIDMAFLQKNGVQIGQFWAPRPPLYFTDAYRGSPPCTLSHHPDNRETGCSNVLIWMVIL